MFQKINKGAKWCVNALLTSIAVVLSLIVGVLAFTVVAISSLNNWLTAE